MDNTLERSDKLGAFFIWFDYESVDFYKENHELLDSLAIPFRHRIYVSRYTPTVIVMLRERKKEELSKDYEITPYYFNRVEKMSEETVIKQINADYVFQNLPEISGGGVNIGVIAANNIIFDANSKSLEGLEIVVFDSLIPPRIDRHPTCVLAEIAGNTLTVDGIEFSGLLKCGKIYFDALYTVNEIFDSIERMLDNNVKIINFSAGTNHDGIYSDFDRQIDRLIANDDFLFVSAVGNFVKAASPAKAYNSLSVGNAVTKSAATTPLSPLYKIAESSAYSIGVDTPSKPEAVAPGEWIGFINAKGEADYENFGTSFSAPLVSGVAGQLWGIKGDLSYLSIKALILATAKEELIEEKDRYKSGYGLIDALGAIELIKRAVIIEGRLNGEEEYEIIGKAFFFIFELDEKKNYPRLYSDGDEINIYPQSAIKYTGDINKLKIVGSGNFRFSLILL